MGPKSEKIPPTHFKKYINHKHKHARLGTHLQEEILSEEIRNPFKMLPLRSLQPPAADKEKIRAFPNELDLNKTTPKLFISRRRKQAKLLTNPKKIKLLAVVARPQNGGR